MTVGQKTPYSLFIEYLNALWWLVTVLLPLPRIAVFWRNCRQDFIIYFYPQKNLSQVALCDIREKTK